MKFNLKAKIKLITLVAAGLVLAGCGDSGPKPGSAPDAKTGRWFNEAQVTLGKTVYEKNCIGCHNANARGTFNWKQPLPDGSYPPPPLNGTAHTWHHNMTVLLRTIDNGGVAMGGKMPAFKGVLSDKEKIAVIAYLQSHWREDIYNNWIMRNDVN